MRTSNQVATLDEAKAEFEASWKQWKAWGKMEETQWSASRLLTEGARRTLQEHAPPPEAANRRELRRPCLATVQSDTGRSGHPSANGRGSYFSRVLRAGDFCSLDRGGRI